MRARGAGLPAGAGGRGTPGPCRNRQACVVLALFVCLWMPSACRRAPEPAAPAAAEAGPRIATTVHMGDPKSAGQLVAGFYDIEDKAWRWTGKQFIVELGSPVGAAQKGATLVFKLTVPPVVIDKLKSVQVGASVDGNVLPPETYSRPGAFSFEREVPAALFAHDSVKVTFDLDKAMTPSGADLRELGVVATSVGLRVK